MDLGGTRSFIVADIPGLIAGAHLGHGLGVRFLKHIERTKLLVHIIDVSPYTGRDPVEDFEVVMRGIEAFNSSVARRAQILVANKVDLLGDDTKRLAAGPEARCGEGASVLRRCRGQGRRPREARQGHGRCRGAAEGRARIRRSAMKRPERIGVFGGTFDPVHNGHLKATWAVGRRFGLSRLLFVPSNIPPPQSPSRNGPGARPDGHGRPRPARAGALRRQSSRDPGGRSRSYSIRTLRKLRKLHPRTRIFFIVGTDAFLEIKTWKEWRSLLDESLFIVMTRPGVSLARARTAPGAAYADRIRAVGRTERIREEWFSRFRIFLLPIDALAVSATEIRSRVRDGRPIAGMVPAPAVRYIREHKLYL